MTALQGGQASASVRWKHHHQRPTEGELNPLGAGRGRVQCQLWARGRAHKFLCQTNLNEKFVSAMIPYSENLHSHLSSLSLIFLIWNMVQSSTNLKNRFYFCDD